MRERFYIKNGFVRDKWEVMFPVFCSSHKEALDLCDFLNRWVKE